MFNECLKVTTHTLTKHNRSQQIGLLPKGVGKCQHLLKWFGKIPKWKRLQAFFGLPPPHCGKC
jgi:hypothetical protein